MEIQSKNTYLTSIRNKMLWHFKRKQIRSVLEDLNSYFETGKANGQNEKELCNELGNPDQFVEKLHHETWKDINTIITIKQLKMIGLLLFSIIMVTALSIHFVNKGGEPLIFSVPVVILPPLFWYFLDGGCLLNINTISLGEKKKYFIAHIFFLLCCLTELIFALLIIHLFKKNDTNLYLFSRAANYISWFLIAFSILICFISIKKFYKGFYASFGILVLFLSTLCTSFCYNYIFLKRFSGIPSVSYILLIFLPNIIGFIISIIYCFKITRSKKLT